jgi:uncharacterized membrane protein
MMKKMNGHLDSLLEEQLFAMGLVHFTLQQFFCRISGEELGLRMQPGRILVLGAPEVSFLLGFGTGSAVVLAGGCSLSSTTKKTPAG